MATRDSANNRLQGVRRGPTVSLDRYSDSSTGQRQGVRRGPTAPSLDSMTDSSNHQNQAVGAVHDR